MVVALLHLQLGSLVHLHNLYHNSCCALSCTPVLAIAISKADLADAMIAIHLNKGSIAPISPIKRTDQLLIHDLLV
jgi:hypothetical protein